MPRYVCGRVTMTLSPMDVLMWKRQFCIELSLFSEAWELGRLPEEVAGWYLRVCSLTQHLETLKPSWSGLAQSLL